MILPIFKKLIMVKISIMINFPKWSWPWSRSWSLTLDYIFVCDCVTASGCVLYYDWVFPSNELLLQLINLILYSQKNSCVKKWAKFPESTLFWGIYRKHWKLFTKIQQHSCSRKYSTIVQNTTRKCYTGIK